MDKQHSGWTGKRLRRWDRHSSGEYRVCQSSKEVLQIRVPAKLYENHFQRSFLKAEAFMTTLKEIFVVCL